MLNNIKNILLNDNRNEMEENKIDVIILDTIMPKTL